MSPRSPGMREFCRILNAFHETEEAIRILETRHRAGLLSCKLLAELEWLRSVRATLEPLVIGYYDDPEDLPEELSRLDLKPIDLDCPWSTGC